MNRHRGHGCGHGRRRFIPPILVFFLIGAGACPIPGQAAAQQTACSNDYYLKQECWGPTEQHIWTVVRSDIPAGTTGDQRVAREEYRSKGVLDLKKYVDDHWKGEDSRRVGKIGNWHKRQIVRPGFLRTILTHSDFAPKISDFGLRIERALICEDLNLEFAKLKTVLWIDKSRFEGNVNFQGVQSTDMISLENGEFLQNVQMSYIRIPTQLNLGRSAIGGALFLDQVDINGNLDMKKTEVWGPTSLISAKIDRQVALIDAWFHGSVTIDTAKFGSDLRLDGIRLWQPADGDEPKKLGSILDAPGRNQIVGFVVPRRSRRSTDLSQQSSACIDEIGKRGAFQHPADRWKNSSPPDLSIKRTVIDGDLFFRTDGSEIGEAVAIDRHLRTAFVQGNFELERSDIKKNLVVDGVTIAGEAKLGGLHVERDFHAGSTFEKPVWLNSATIGGSAELKGSRLCSLDLTDTTVGRLLSFGTGSIESKTLDTCALGNAGSCWRPTADCPIPKLTLANATISNFVGSVTASLGRESYLLGTLPQNIEGGDRLSFENWEGIVSPNQVHLLKYEHLRWNWLPESTPLEWHIKIAQNVRNGGGAKLADEIILEARRHQRANTGKEDFGRYVLLFMLDNVIGFGFEIWRAFVAAAIIVLAGAFVFSWTPEGARVTALDRLVFSLDRMLPIISIDKKHDDVVITGPWRYYFYLHTAIGFTLVTFIALGFSGLTK